LSSLHCAKITAGNINYFKRDSKYEIQYINGKSVNQKNSLALANNIRGSVLHWLNKSK
jgi:uncharacterized protein YlbG (UPF0298 family)